MKQQLLHRNGSGRLGGDHENGREREGGRGADGRGSNPITRDFHRHGRGLGQVGAVQNDHFRQEAPQLVGLYKLFSGVNKVTKKKCKH